MNNRRKKELAAVSAFCKAARAAEGLTQEQFAELTGISRSQIASLERGFCTLTLANLAAIWWACEAQPVGLSDKVAAMLDVIGL